MGSGAAVRQGQGLLAPKHQDPLGLVIVGGGGIAAGLQDPGQRLLFHGLIAEFAERIPLRCQFFKIHRDLPFV